MFGFRHKLPAGFFRGACDVHCHLLPGVDDGMPSAEASIEALKALEAQGIRRMTLTPHFMKEYPDNNRSRIVPRFEAFKAEASKVCKVELGLAAEYMMDSCFMTHFQQGFLTLDKGGTHVLCETSYMMPERNVASMLYEIMCEGFQPVIAHPERYVYASKAHYSRWKDKSYKFQLNLLSLAGAYGGEAVGKARFLLNEGMYDYVGSDLHKWDTFERFSSQIKLGAKDLDKLAQLIENNKQLLG